MTKAELLVKKKLKALPYDKKYKRVADLFYPDFVKGLAIAPAVYNRVNVTTPIEGTENRGTRGMRVKRQFIHNVFTCFLDKVVEKMIETNKVFVAPLFTMKVYMFIGKKKDADIDALFSKSTGIYTVYNPIDIDFTLYNLYFRIDGVATFPVKMDLARYTTMMNRMAKGMKYYDYFVRPDQDIHLLRTSDFYDDMLETFDGLTKDILKKIVIRGFIRMVNLKMKYVRILIANCVYGITYKL